MLGWWLEVELMMRWWLGRENFRGAAHAGRGWWRCRPILYMDKIFANCLVYCINMVRIVTTDGAGSVIHYGAVGETVGVGESRGATSVHP